MNQPNCWILAIPRSGSQYIAAILNKTFNDKLFYEKFHPYQNVNKEYFLKNLCEFKTAIIHPSQYTKIFGKTPIQEILQHLPSLKLIRLERQDFMEQLTSLYIAKQTNIWAITKDHVQPHQTQNDINDFQQKRIVIDESLAIKCHSELTFDRSFWSDGLTIDYETLISSTVEVIRKIIKHMDVEIDINVIIDAIQNCDIQKMERNDKCKIKRVLKTLLAP